MTGQSQSQSQHYQAKVNFYHSETGTRNTGDVFCVNDSRVAQQLEQTGYIQKVDEQSHAGMMKAQQEQQAKQQEYGQAQQAANEQAGIAAHTQNVDSHKLTQEMAQARQQAQQQAQNQQMSQTDKALIADKAEEFQANATTNAQTQAKVTEARAAKAGNRAVERNENK